MAPLGYRNIRQDGIKTIVFDDVCTACAGECFEMMGTGGHSSDHVAPFVTGCWSENEKKPQAHPADIQLHAEESCLLWSDCPQKTGIQGELHPSGLGRTVAQRSGYASRKEEGGAKEDC